MLNKMYWRYKMNKFRKIMVTVVAMALLVMGGTAVFAQQADNGSSTPIQQTDDGTQGDLAPFNQGNGQRGGPQGHGNGGENGRLLDHDVASAAIADALGITVEELQAAQDEGTTLPDLAESLGVDMEVVQAAIQAVRAEAIAQAVADGTITQEQADAMAERAALQTVIRDIFDRDAMDAVKADVLGMTVEELQAAQDEGIRLPQLAEEAGIEMSVLTDAMQQAKADALQTAVDDGLITQEQADTIASHAGPGNHGSRQGGQGGHGGHGGQGGRPNGGGQLNGGQQSQGTFNAAPVGTDA
jgi:hypothetical protein